MQKIFLESANSYKGSTKATTWDAVLAAYYKDVKIDKLYSVIKRTTDQVRVEHLKGYVYATKGESAEDGCLVDGGTTAAALIACLAGCKETGHDVIYFISANSAHHFSYPLSMHAFAATKNRTKKKVVVNFDNHRDYHNVKKIITPAEAVGATAIRCGGWGAFHVGYWSDKTEGGAEYITLANGKEVLLSIATEPPERHLSA